MGDGETKQYSAVIPGGVELPEAVCAARMVKNLLILAGNEFIGARDVSCLPGGRFLFAARRRDNLWVVLRIIPRSGYKDQVEKGAPHRQILGLKMAGDQPFYVGWPGDPADNRPHVCWGETKGKPYDAIDHNRLQWKDGEPLYIASLASKELVVQGTRESKPYDEIIPPLFFAVGRPLYRAKLGQKMVLVWGEKESRPCDDISVPSMEDKKIVAFATDGTRIYELTVKTM
ncbi:MAG: hypothetical protein WC445_03710 [Patescibacteria group bacterium]